jgi:hypothetical protein
MSSDRLHRRGLLKALAALGGLAASGCDRLSNEPRFRSVLDAANSLTYRAQRLLIGADRSRPNIARPISRRRFAPMAQPTRRTSNISISSAIISPIGA